MIVSKLSNAWYDRLKWIAQIGLPGIGTFYATMDQIWGVLPAGAEVAASILAVDTLLGLYLGLSSSQYKKSDESAQGFIRQVGVDPETGIPHLETKFTELPQEFLQRDTVTLKVGTPPLPKPPIEEH